MRRHRRRCVTDRRNDRPMLQGRGTRLGPLVTSGLLIGVLGRSASDLLMAGSDHRAPKVRGE